MLDEVARFQQDILRREVPPKQAEKDRTHAWTCEGCFELILNGIFFFERVVSCESTPPGGQVDVLVPDAEHKVQAGPQ